MMTTDRDWSPRRPRGGFFMPGPEFWRIWGTASLFAVLAWFLFGTDHAWPAERVLTESAWPFWQAEASPGASVLSEAQRWIGHGNITGSHRAWCADFANWVLSRTGHRPSGSGIASSPISS